MRRYMQVPVMLLLVASWGVSQEKNQISGVVLNGDQKSQTNEPKHPPLKGMVILTLDGEKHPISSRKTDDSGRFILIVPPSVAVFALTAYDPDSNRWVFGPVQISNTDDHQDLGTIYLYSSSTKLSDSQVAQQIAAAQVLENIDSSSAARIRVALLADYSNVVRTQVENALNQEPNLGKRKITVAVSEGSIRLYGTVQQPGEKEKATKIAQRYAGYSYVRNEMLLDGVPTTKPTTSKAK